MNVFGLSRPVWIRCLAAGFVVAMAFGFRLWLLGGVGPAIPYLTFYPAVMLAAVFGGLVSGVLATFLSAILVMYYFMTPVGHFRIEDPTDILGLITFICGCFLITMVGEAMLRYRDRLRQQAGNLKQTNQLLQQEIAGHRRTAESLRQTEERFRLAIQEAPMPIMIHAEDGQVLSLSRAWSEITGYTVSDIPTTADWTERAYGTRQEQVLADIDALYSMERRKDEGEYEVACRDGSKRIWDFASAPLGRINGLRTVISMALDVTARKQAENAMAVSLNEKEILLREIHHRVKNNLNIVSSLLCLQEDVLDHPAALEALAVSRGRVTSMAMIHEQLYRSSTLSKVDLDEYLRQFLPRVIAVYKGGRNISLVLEPSSVNLTLDQAIPLGLIINELVTNSLKHAFKNRDHGQVRVWAEHKDNAITLVVADDGEGLPAGYEKRAASSLGLQIVGMLAKQLRGKLTVESCQGASFRLDFPCQNGGGATV